jgi:phosphoglycolate phosphatase-like HAD superfamily hydrolase
MTLPEKCKSWGYEEWNDFNNPVFQNTFNKLSEKEQNQILAQKNLFWECYNGGSNAISEEKNKNPEDSREEFEEDSRNNQEKYIKDRGASMVFYSSFIDALSDLSDKEFRDCITALTNYGFYKIKLEYKGITKMFMAQAIPQIAHNELKRETARNNGKYGGAPKGNQNAKKQPKTTKNNP